MIYKIFAIFGGVVVGHAVVVVVVVPPVVVVCLVVPAVVVGIGSGIVVTMIVSGGETPTVRPTESPIVSMVSTKATAMAITAFVFKAMDLFKFSR